jgi:acyl-CoA synthetase (AMP-forming)/AMP-acid ligase II
LNNHLTIQIALGGTSIILRKFDPESMLRTIEEESVTLISGVPALFNMLLQYPDSERFDTSSVTKCTAGSDKLPMEVKKRLLEFFPNIKGVYDVYGCTEASPSIAILNARDSLRKDGSVGRPLPFLDARIIDEGGGTVPAGEVGELICKGPNVMEGYYGNPEGTAEAIRDGWLYTGDLARMDDEGFLFIVDRKKDMILSGGENIYPRELEEVLIRHPAVVDVCVVGVPEPEWGESVKAFIVRKEGVELDEETVVTYCKEHLASYKKPKYVEFISTIPRNPSGKALKRSLREKGV